MEHHRKRRRERLLNHKTNFIDSSYNDTWNTIIASQTNNENLQDLSCGRPLCNDSHQDLLLLQINSSNNIIYNAC